jgi:hypothetical protein
MAGLLTLILAMLAAISPLTREQQIAIDTAFDGRDHQESAFIALLENAATWTTGPDDTPVRLHVDVDALRADPDAYRGALYRIEGVLQDRERLAAPYERVELWYLRLNDKTPIAVYLPVTDAGPLIGTPPAAGTRIVCFARFYKRLEGENRRGRMAQWAAFVGNHPDVVAPVNPPASSTPTIVIAAVLLMFIVFAGLLIIARRTSSRRRDRLAFRTDDDDDDDRDDAVSLPPLPDDPADALAELRHRAEKPSP